MALLALLICCLSAEYDKSSNFLDSIGRSS